MTIAPLLLLAATLDAQSPIQTQLFKASSPYSGAVNAVAVDSSGNVFAAGTAALGVFVARVNPDFQAAFVSTIRADIGQANAIALDKAGNVYVTGTTNSSRSTTASDTVKPTVIGCEATCSSDAFLAKVDGTTGELLYITYIGGRSTESGTGVAVAADGDIYIAGTTASTDFPVSTGALVAVKPATTAGFVARVSADGKKLVASTYFKGAPQALALSEAGAVYLTGQTSEANPGTPGAYSTETVAANLMSSADSGSTWNTIAVPARVIWIEPDPTNPGVLYAGTAAGLVKSSDGGASWQDMGGPFTSVSVTQVRVDPTNGNTIYATAATESSQSSSGSIATQALWKSVDSGATWTRLVKPTARYGSIQPIPPLCT